MLSIVVLPAIPVFAETGQAGSTGELTLADFQRMHAGQKAIVARSEYERYQYRLKHPAPQPNLNVSRMRAENPEKTLTDFQRSAATKPGVAIQQYREYQYGLTHPVKFEPSIERHYPTGGKLIVDWWNAHEAKV